MRTSRTADLMAPRHPDAPLDIETPGWDPDRRELERRSNDRARKWLADNALKLIGIVVAGGTSLLLMLGLRMEGTPQDLARFKASAAAVDSATSGRVSKVEGVVAVLVDDNREFRSAIKEQRFLICYLIDKQDPSAVRAIQICNGAKAP
jgi:hypothetical protein